MHANIDRTSPCKPTPTGANPERRFQALDPNQQNAYDEGPSGPFVVSEGADMISAQMHHIDQASVVRITPDATPVPSFIVLGRDEGGKAHASWFAAEDRPAAERAAALMGMHGLVVDDDGLAAIAGRLPRGKLFASGRAFVPFVKGSTFDQLVARLPVSVLTSPVRATPCDARNGALKAATIGKPTSHAAQAPKGSAPATGASAAAANGAGASGGSGGSGAGGSAQPAPRNWGSLAAGDTVLALEGPEEGWWEATVVEVREGELVLLRWRDFPGTPTFSRRRTAIALLHPDRDKA